MCSKYENHFRLNSEHNVLFGGPKWPFDEHQKLYFDNELDIHTSSENHEQSDLKSDLRITSYNSCVSYRRRSALVGRSNHWRPNYLTLKYGNERMKKASSECHYPVS